MAGRPCRIWNRGYLGETEAIWGRWADSLYGSLAVPFLRHTSPNWFSFLPEGPPEAWSSWQLMMFSARQESRVYSIRGIGWVCLLLPSLHPWVTGLCSVDDCQ